MRTIGERLMSNNDEKVTREFPVLSSVQHVVENARRVFLHAGPLLAAARQWGPMLEASPAWQHPCHYFDDTAQTVRWIFVLDVLNHCFWADPGAPTWSVSYRRHTYSGYWGLAASLKRAVENGVPITRSNYLARLRCEDLQQVFAGNGQIPMLPERLENLREAGRVLLSEWQGDIVHLLEAAGGSAVKTIALVTAAFPSFRDQALYRGETVTFWKRAQIFAADLYLAFAGRGWGSFRDIGRLTAFADYKLPQVLRELGALS
ncbi:MAG: queuosine salvage family protein [Desulfobacterales bacterium]